MTSGHNEEKKLLSNPTLLEDAAKNVHLADTFDPKCGSPKDTNTSTIK